MSKVNQERKDALRIELTSVRRDMQGINPKLSIYQKLKDREKEIIHSLENNYVKS